MVTLERSITLDRAVKGTPIRSMVRDFGDETILAALAGMILRMASFFNLTRPMTDEQALDTAGLLIDKYPVETLEDFTLMFRNAKTGQYGQLFNRLDGQIIFEWMAKYLDDKAAYREKLHRAQKFSSGEENLMQVVQKHTQELNLLQEAKINQIGKPVIDALKEGIGYESLKKSEETYNEYKKNYLKTKIMQEKRN